VNPLRAVGFLVVMWTSIVCYLRDEGSYSGQKSWTGYVGLGIVTGGLWILGILAAILVQQRAVRLWQTEIQATGLGETLKELSTTADLVLVEDALGGGSMVGKQKRKELFLKEINETLTASRLAQLLVRFEEKILAERLSFEFLDGREEWRKSLLLNNQEGSPNVTYNVIATQTNRLKNSIRPRAPLATINKHVLAAIFSNKLPEYVAWEVFSYLYDVEPLRKVLAPLLSLTNEGRRPFAAQPIYLSYNWWGHEAYAVTMLRYTKRALLKTIREAYYDAAKVQAKRTFSPEGSPHHDPLRHSTPPLNWSCSDCTLINGSSRTTCEACGQVRDPLV